MYVLNNIREFYLAYLNKTELYYGKQLRFIPKKELFQENSKELFDIIINYGKMLLYYEKLEPYARGNISYKNILISEDKLDEFFNMIKKKPLEIQRHYSKYKEMYIQTDEDLEIKCVLKKETVQIRTSYLWYEDEAEESEEYVLRLNIENYDLLFSNEFIYIFYEGKIYKKEKTSELRKLFEQFEGNERILIPEDKLSDFQKFVMPKLEIEADNLPAEIETEAIIPNKLACKILLDADDERKYFIRIKVLLLRI